MLQLPGSKFIRDVYCVSCIFLLMYNVNNNKTYTFTGHLYERYMHPNYRLRTGINYICRMLYYKYGKDDMIDQ